jgi:hypothetical protein
VSEEIVLGRIVFESVLVEYRVSKAMDIIYMSYPWWETLNQNLFWKIRI